MLWNRVTSNQRMLKDWAVDMYRNSDIKFCSTASLSCSNEHNEKSRVFQDAPDWQRTVWGSRDARQMVWKGYASFRSDSGGQGVASAVTLLLTTNMARKLLRSVNNSSTEVFFGSMAKYSSKFWYSVSMLVCRITNLPYCSRAILLKLWGHVVKVSNSHRALSYAGNSIASWWKKTRFISRKEIKANNGRDTVDGENVAFQTCDSVSLATAAVFTATTTCREQHLRLGPLPAACQFFWHANTFLKKTARIFWGKLWKLKTVKCPPC